MTFDIEQELEQINQYTRKAVTQDDVYLFTLTLCDNEVDREFERFTPEALKQLAELFKGKTGLFDHSCKSEQQSARVFSTWVETDSTRTTTQGEPYTSLKARAYMIRTKENEALISLCCSVCGADRRTEGCDHRKGHTYNGQLCHDVLRDARDAYEWSFVAVPAQRAAGVTKAFLKEEPMNPEILETVKAADTGLSLSKPQLRQLQTEIAQLEQAGADAAAYRAKLLSEIGRGVTLALPQIDKSLFLEGCKAMHAQDLERLCESLKAQTQSMQRRPQLFTKTEQTPTDNHAFCI